MPKSLPQFAPFTLDIEAGATQNIPGGAMMRGAIGRGAVINSRGHLKLGDFSKVNESVTINAAGKEVALSDKFKAQYGLKINADLVTIGEISPNDDMFPPEHLMAGPIVFTAPRINARAASFLPESQMVVLQAPPDAANRHLTMGSASGYSTKIINFNHIDAVTLTDFAHSPNADCGINCLSLDAVKVENAMVRAQEVDISEVSGTVECLPQHGAYGYGDKKRGIVSGRLAPEWTIATLKEELAESSEEREYFKAQLRHILTVAINTVRSHPRDFAASAETKPQLEQTLAMVEAFDPWNATKDDIDKIVGTVTAIPDINIVQMLYRHAATPDEIAYSSRTHVNIDTITGGATKPASVTVYYGNLTVRDSIAAYSKITVENGKITLGNPDALGKNVAIRANEIHFSDVPDKDTLEASGVRLDGQVFCNGARHEELDLLNCSQVAR